ncbi:MAG: hypothetical protein V4598_03950 [Bdellovibrionota bacterium]
MMKLALLLLCEVYGISDSPQNFSCRFQGEELALTCKEGIYQLNDEAVDVAYHMEVEEGPVPLVFHSSKYELTVLTGKGRRHQATLLRDGKSLTGNCRN